MNILGIGPIELLIIAVLAMIVLGPKGISDLAYKAGRVARKITRSPFWTDIVTTSRDINELPKKILNEANLQDDLREIHAATTTDYQTEKDSQEQEDISQKTKREQTH